MSYFEYKFVHVLANFIFVSHSFNLFVLHMFKYILNSQNRKQIIKFFIKIKSYWHDNLVPEYFVSSEFEDSYKKPKKRKDEQNVS